MSHSSPTPPDTLYSAAVWCQLLWQCRTSPIYPKALRMEGMGSPCQNHPWKVSVVVGEDLYCPCLELHQEVYLGGEGQVEWYCPAPRYTAWCSGRQGQHRASPTTTKAPGVEGGATRFTHWESLLRPQLLGCSAPHQAVSLRGKGAPFCLPHSPCPTSLALWPGSGSAWLPLLMQRLPLGGWGAVLVTPPLSQHHKYD